MSSYNDNIQNAFEVVKKTLENVEKLMKYCDTIADNSVASQSVDVKDKYYICTKRFIRNNSDVSVDGWIYTKFFKVYQCGEDTEVTENGWRVGPLYVLEINLEKEPVYYVSKFEYNKEDIREWESGISPASWKQLYEPKDRKSNTNTWKELTDEYIECKVKQEYQKKYWNVKRVVFKQGNLTELTSGKVKEKIFEEFNKLKFK